MPRIYFPAPLAKKVGLHSLETKEGALYSALREICKAYPAIQPYLFVSNALAPFVKIFINQIDSNQLKGLDTFLHAHDEVQIVLSISGG